MRKCLTMMLAVVLLLEVAQPALPQEAAPAGPFWEVRPYSEWKSTELIQFFTDSPWSRQATLTEPSTQLTLGAPRYYVQWYSAQVMREALVRRRQLAGQSDPSAAADFLARVHTAYEVYVFAALVTPEGSLRVVGLGPFEVMTEAQIQEATLLQFSAQEYSSRPDGVELLRDTQTQELRGLRLIFARARQAVPPEQATAGQVQLTCGMRQGSLSVRFSLSEMQRGGKPDL